MARKVFILGLDSMPPSILYSNASSAWLQYLHGLVKDSARYVMRSCHPPITVPAWMVMFTGRSPGELGIYGFRHRKPGSFDYYIVDSTHIRYPTLWDILGRHGLRVGVFGVPPTFPPRPVHGWLVTDFTTPSPEKPYTFPPWLRREIEQVAGPMVFDIVYRSHDKSRVARELFTMVYQHLRVVEYLATRKPWDVLVYVEIGVDRAHHAFWKYFDKNHPRYEEHPEYSQVIPHLYKMIDKWFEKLHKKMPKDTIVVIASDHGVKAMKGAFTINQWLIEQDYLKLREQPKKQGQDLTRDIIDWEHTIAWAWGGYYSRVFINLKGREEKGVIDPKYYEETIKQLKNDLERIRGPNNEQWRNMVYTPSELYTRVEGDAPDLMVYLDDLWWRPAGTIGWDTNYLPENDRGPDDAVHDWNGVLAIHDPEATLARGDRGIIRAENVLETLLEVIASRK